MNVTACIFGARWHGLHAVLAALLLPGLDVLGQGTILYRDIDDVPLFTLSGSVFYDLDFDQNGSADITFRARSTDFSAFPKEANRLLAIPATSPDQGGFMYPLQLGESIGPFSESPLSWENPGEGRLGPIGFVFTSCMAVGDDVGCLGLFTGRNAYMGAEFQIDGQLHYGWVRVDVSLAGANGGWITEYAYETRPGMPIKAGAKPVPIPMATPEVARAGYLRLKWPAQIGKAYQVQAKGRLDACPWANLSFVMPATATNMMADLPMINVAQFFRVVEAD